MKYLCTNCNYVFDEALGDSSEGIPSGTKIENLEFCPVCFEYDTFHHINEVITYLKENTKDKIEQEHFIEAFVKDDKIEVIVGENTHPIGEHRIAWAGIFDEYGDLVEEKFLQEDDDSVIEFFNHDLGTFEIRIKCSKHKLFGRKFED